MPDLRTFTLWARAKLTGETENLLLQVYGLEPSGKFLSPSKLPVLARMPEAMETRKRLETLFADEQEAGIAPADAYQKLVKEVAFTHLNRLVALKLMEGRKLMRGAIDRYHDSNGFKVYLAGHDAELLLFEQGSMPPDDLSEGPRDRAYRHFLLWQSGELAKEVRVLFDPENVASRLFPRPRVLRDIIDALNADDMKEAWAPGNEETIGWIYQAFNSEELERAFNEARLVGKKFGKDEIPSVTQLFTPRLAVRFLVDNTLGRLWLAMHPDSELAESAEYLTPLPVDPPKSPLKPVKEIRALDPATGTMHFGLFAFDLLHRMYREELTNAGKPGWPERASVTKEDDIPAAILANNLFGIDIDLRAVQLAALALFLRAKSHNKNAILTESKLACADVAVFRGQHLANIAKEVGLPQGVTRDLFQTFCDSINEASMMGSLVRLETHFQNFAADTLRKAVDDYVVVKAKQGVDESYFGNETSKGLRLLDVLTRRYDVVFTNPPYISARKMNADMSRFMKSEYPAAKGDLYAGFIQRCLELTCESGRTGMLTMHSFMFISSYEKLRNTISNTAGIEAVAHYGPGLFAVGNPGTLQTAAFVLRRESFQSARNASTGVYFRLVKESDAEAKKVAFEAALARRKSGEVDQHVYEYRQGEFGGIPGNPWVYWADSTTKRAFATLPSLGSLYAMDMGLKTSGNTRFVRCWWEVGMDRVGHPKTRAEAAGNQAIKWYWYAKSDKGVGLSQLRYVVNWQEDGQEIKAHLAHQYPYLNGRVDWCTHNENLYFQPCITWSPVSSTGFKARIVPAGVITSNAAYGIFADQGVVGQLYAYLMSLPGRYLIKILCSTINHNKGDIEGLPIPAPLLGHAAFCALAGVHLNATENSDRNDETAASFIEPAQGQTSVFVLRDHGSLDTYVAKWLGMEDQISFMSEFLSLPVDEDASTAAELDDERNDPDEAEGELPPLSTLATRADENLLAELAQRRASYAVGIALGRFQPGVEGALGCGRFNPEIAAKLRPLTGAEGLMVLEESHPDDLAARIIEILNTIHGDIQAEQIVRSATGSQGALRQSVEDYLLGAFFKEHVKRYRKRPVYWLLQSPDRQFSAYLFQERATDQTLAILQGKRYLGGRIHTLSNKLQEAKAKEASTSGREKAVWKSKAHEIAEILEDLRAFDQHISAANNFVVEDANGNPKTVRWTPEFDDGVLLNAAPLYELTPSWKRADAKLDLKKAWKDLESGKYDWAKTAMRYWPRRVLKACQKNKSFAIAHGLA